MIKRLFIIVIAIFLIFLTGCDKLPERGVVVDKRYDEGYSYVTTCTGISFDGKVVTSICQQYQPPSWTLKIAVDGEKTPMWWSVPERTYVSCDVGDVWTSIDDDRRGMC